MKHIRHLALLLVLVLAIVSLGAPALAKGTYLGWLTVVNCSSWVTLRSSPSTSASSVAKVPLGSSVEGYYYNSQFTECYWNGKHGYILSTYLSNGSSGSASSSSSSYLGKKTIVNCNEFVTLRAYASTSAPTVTKVAKGQKVDAYYYNGTFCRCFYNGLEGYILSKYLGGSGGSSSTKHKVGDYMGALQVVKCKSYVTLRQYADTKAAEVAKVPLGAIVDAYYWDSEFYECYYKGKNGFILRSYLK